ncbi:septum formation family protein [Dactylosporangium sp. NBC_01737]|uniref:septum formation family protein n=1 Tax=Dactylosporangium sp. NBC_01737 TaxID=2975959 RepID=UPI002E164815|nr:septum formation family protein [Dactylosporangium sp. NBC_01737]
MVAVLALVLAAAAGCAKVPKGVDRDLVDEWTMMAEAKVPEPKVGDCWTSAASDIYDVMDAPAAVTQTPCDYSHFAETVHVGQFTGPQADADRAPLLADMAEQYKTCNAEAAKFLGAPWANGRLRMLVFPPSNSQWHGGARFFRCDLAALRTEAGVLDPRKETLKDTLQPGGTMLLGCSVRVGAIESWDDLTPAACTAPHDVEFAGVVTSAIGTYPVDGKAMEAAFDDACWDRIRAFTGSSNSTLSKVSYGYWGLSGQDGWKAGDHDARCYVMLSKKISRSLKNNGSAAI